MRIVTTLGLVAAGILVSSPVARPRRTPPTESTRSRPPSCRACTPPPATHPGIFNEAGARVLLSGVNVNGLGEYFQANPDFAPTVPLGSDDFEQIAALGFNSVRLIVSWSALEPTRGAYDTAYVDRIREAVDQAADNGLYTVLDMHQDAYGIAVDTPLGDDLSDRHPARQRVGRGPGSGRRSPTASLDLPHRRARARASRPAGLAELLRRHRRCPDRTW